MKKIQSLITSLRKLGFVSIAQEISEKVLQEQLPEDVVPDKFNWIFGLGIRYKDMDSLDLFMQQNLDQLQRIDSAAKGFYKKIGGGYEGSAFLIGNGDMVLKIQEDFYYHPHPEAEGEKELKQLFGGKASPDQIMVYDQGILTLPQDGEDLISGGKLYWKIMERVNVEGWQKEFGPELQSAVDREILSLAAQKSLYEDSDPEWVEENFGTEAFNDAQHIVRAAILLGCENKEDRKYIAQKVAKSVSSYISSTIKKIEEMQKDLPKDWLENYIESVLYEMCLKDKMDFGAENFGRRRNTGRFVWFDA